MFSACTTCLFAAIMPVADAVQLASANIREERPLEIRGQVMGITEEGSFSISDASGSAFIHSSATNQISVGDIVTVRGMFRPERGGFTRLQATDIVKEGSQPPAAPNRATLQEITSGRFNYQVVRTQGVVSDASPDEIDSRYTLITLTDGDSSVVMPWPRDNDYSGILDARIELVCVCRPTYFTSRLFSPYLLDPCSEVPLRVVEPPPADWFSVDSVSSLRRISPSEIFRLGRRRATGTVMAVWDETHVLIRTADTRTKIVKAELRGNTPLPVVGNDIELVGYPETDLFAPLSRIFAKGMEAAMKGVAGGVALELEVRPRSPAGTPSGRVVCAFSDARR